MLYVSHRLEEIFRVADTVTVLRDGEQVATRPIETCDKNTLVSLMIGRSLDTYFPGHLDSKPGKTLLRVTGLSSPGKFSDITFELHAGEILGLAGLVGSGRTEVAEALFGLDPHTTGRVEIRDEPVAIAGARSMRRMGMGLVPEDRKRHGLVLGMTARENISLPLLDRLSRLGWIRRGMEKALVQRYFERLRVRARSVDAPAYSLSGGNQQKLIMARWLAASCSILLVDEPTRGVDVGAKAEIHALLDDLARQGAGLLLISSELPEILNLSSRILVLRRGRLVGEVARAGASQESVMRLMAGITPAGTS